jgi:hypothetical protein
MFMFASIVTTLQQSSCHHLRIRKLLISQPILRADISAIARQTGKFFDTWSNTVKMTVGSLTCALLGREADLRNDADLRVAGDLVSALLRKIAAMSVGLRADLHIHTREAEPFIAYDARAVITRAAREGYRALSISNHDTLTFDDELAAYARDLGIVLIPGVEVTIEGRHVLVYNADVAVDKITTFAGLRRYRTPEWLVVAPHPFFPAAYCLREKLWQEIELFDAIEFSHFYTPRVDFNRAAVKLARALGLPLIGTSDSHLDEQFGTTFSLIDAAPTVEGVLSAIKGGHVSVVSRPLSLTRCATIVARHTLGAGRQRVRTWLRSDPPAPQTILTPR